MKKIKSKYLKALAVLLSMAMLLTSLPVPIYAESVSTPTDTEELTPAEDLPVEEEITVPDESAMEEPALEDIAEEESPAEPLAEETFPVPDESAEQPDEIPMEDESGEEIPADDPAKMPSESFQDDATADELFPADEPTQETEENTAEEAVTEEVPESELPVELLPEEPMPPEETPVELPLEDEEEPIVYQHPVQAAVDANGYAYLITEYSVRVFDDEVMQNHTFTIEENSILLVTAFIEQGSESILEVQFLSVEGEVHRAFVYASDLPDAPLSSEELDTAALTVPFAITFVGESKALVFEAEIEAAVVESPAESELPVEAPIQEGTEESIPLEDAAQSAESPMLFASAPMLYASYPYGFSLRDNYAYTGNFYAGQTGVHGDSGDDSYPQLAACDEEGTVYATPHYLDGVIVYCLEHNYPGPGERDGDDDYEPTGPYTIVDLAGYKTTPGYSGDVFSDNTMHAIAWVIRHSYPFMVLDNYESENENWSRAAGQFAIRQVIRELEGKQYVRYYWDLDDFYVRADSAPEEYLEYARWLASNAISYASSAGSITASNKSTTYSNGSYIGTVTLTTDADLMRISRSVGTLTGNSGGSDGSYYYLYSGDTISVASSSPNFTIKAETIPSADDEANFLVGVSEERIQKVIIPQDGDPYPLKSVSVTFDVPLGAITVTKKDAASGKTLSGTVFAS